MEEQKLKILVSRREHCFRTIQILYDLSKEVLGDKQKTTAFNARFKKLESVKTEFYELNDQIHSLQMSINPESTINNGTLLSFDDLYYSIVAVADSLDSQPSNVTHTNSENKIQVRLPKLDTPKFDGQIENWQTFIDSFSALVHKNSSLSPIEKFHYLVSSLSGPALGIVKCVPLTANNYDIVYNALLDRYQNKRILATAYLDKICKATPITSPTYDNLSKLTSTLYESINALMALDIESMHEFVLFYLSARLLDADTRKRFETQNNSEMPTFQQLLTYLQNYIKILEVSKPSSSATTNKSVSETNRNKGRPSLSYAHAHATGDKRLVKQSLVTSVKNHNNMCPCCNMQHNIYKCDKFRNMSISLRRKLASDLKLCFNCLRSNHATQNCSSLTSCLKCGGRHHTWLHLDDDHSIAAKSAPDTNVVESDPAGPSGNNAPATSLALACTPAHSPRAAGVTRSRSHSVKLLGTAVVRVRDASGTFQTARALIDSCSHDSFITTSCAQRLGLRSRRCKLSIAGLGSNVVQNIRGVTSSYVLPRNNESPGFEISFVILPTITSNMPIAPIPLHIRSKFENLTLADPVFYNPTNIDLLLGVEVFDQIYDGRRYAPGPGLPVALHSIYGWVVTGQFNAPTPQCDVSSLVVSTHALENIVQRFWEIEEPPQARVSLPEHDVCEQLYSQHTYRDVDGRYVVPIMLKDEPPSLGDSYRHGVKRFINIEKRLARDSQLKSEYIKFMQEYEALGHMQPVEPVGSHGTYIIPHHCVVRPTSATTKLRVVFDASCKTTTDVSLNDIVYAGPKLQVDITHIITKFRIHAIVFTADICKMYRQILIRKQDRRYQHILWRESVHDPLREYELNTVTYGVSSSPYLAIRTLRQLAADHGDQYPRAAEVLREETYVDDVICGAPSLDAASQLRDDLINLLKLGQFELRKWGSNHPSLLDTIPSEHCQLPKTFTEIDQNLPLKILGIKWDPNFDYFTYSASEINIEYTKRSILSTVARIFDPLGWIAPVVFSAKVLLQELWHLKLTWDERVPDNIAKQWRYFSCNLNELTKIRLPRLILPSNPLEINLVGFCDGSSKGYGCCVYLTVVADGETRVSLLLGKSKVAPLKPVTINRLELCGAVLLSRVIKHFVDLLGNKINLNSITAFTDSTTVLSWLRTEPCYLKTFVANRVVQICDRVDISSWRHVSTHENPADCCSRGSPCIDFATHPLWWSGPAWLAGPSSQWPTHQVPESDEAASELKLSVSHSLIETPSVNFCDIFCERFSSLTKLQRTLAWCLRFSTNVKLPASSRNLSVLSVSELEHALIVLIKAIQSFYFENEIKLIKLKSPCLKYVQKLSPYIDSDGLLRVGGRIKNAGLPESVRHPILLPKRCRLSILIIDYYHIVHLHCGPRALQSLIQRKYWILGIRLLIRSRLSKCVPCFKAKPISCQPAMGDLPSVRLDPSRSFQNVGIDFGGPFMLKESRRRNARIHKAYICLFVCLSTKAIHLEVVSELSTEAFIAALDRFVARRGLCKRILTDCGTNFVGAKRYLNEMFDMLTQHQTDLAPALSSRAITWDFNPPAGPHFGGIWESGIRCTKYHLKRVVGSQTLNLEEMFTVLAKVEAMLNSRPLCALSSDPTECDVLTPGHFLVGGPLVALPELPLEDIPLHPRSRWQMLQRLTQSFWRIWQRDYIHTLQQRTKWLVSERNIRLGDIVMISEPNLPPTQWKLGRIHQVHPGHDQVVRVVTVKTDSGLLRRPVVKICPLPIN